MHHVGGQREEPEEGHHPRVEAGLREEGEREHRRPPPGPGRPGGVDERDERPRQQRVGQQDRRGAPRHDHIGVHHPEGGDGHPGRHGQARAEDDGQVPTDPPRREEEQQQAPDAHREPRRRAGGPDQPDDRAHRCGPGVEVALPQAARSTHPRLHRGREEARRLLVEVGSGVGGEHPPSGADDRDRQRHGAEHQEGQLAPADGWWSGGRGPRRGGHRPEVTSSSAPSAAPIP